jgi:hypothetical protein
MENVRIHIQTTSQYDTDIVKHILKRVNVSFEETEGCKKFSKEKDIVTIAPFAIAKDVTDTMSSVLGSIDVLAVVYAEL